MIWSAILSQTCDLTRAINGMGAMKAGMYEVPVADSAEPGHRIEIRPHPRWQSHKAASSSHMPKPKQATPVGLIEQDMAPALSPRSVEPSTPDHIMQVHRFDFGSNFRVIHHQTAAAPESVEPS